jgi:CRP-like cAMP-binding protein
MDQDAALHRLATEGWLSHVTPAFRDALLPMARWHRGEPGHYLTRAGDEMGDLIGLAEGTVTFTVTEGMDSTPTMHLAEAVVWMGYGPLVLPMVRTVTAEARTPVLYATFAQSRVQRLLLRDPAGWQAIARLSGEFGLLMALTAADLLIPDSERRCAAVLLRFSGQRFAGPRDAQEVTVPVTQEELAAAANLSRNSTGAILRRFAAQVWIATGYGGIRVMQPERLRALLG